jgi:hypothetical protein
MTTASQNIRQKEHGDPYAAGRPKQRVHRALTYVREIHAPLHGDDYLADTFFS